STLPLQTPKAAFAIPFAHYLDHFRDSGAEAHLTALLADPAFHTDAKVRGAGLAELRRLIMTHATEPALRAELEAVVLARFGEAELRFRSSSNMEDLDTFNGAGLHTSSSASAAASAEVSLDEALRIVWASLWNERAYDEREAGHLDQTAARMGVLVHERYDGEAAQGVAISRNLLDVTRSDMYYVDAQHGEASVTNPAPGVSTEQLVYSWQRSPEVVYQSHSSLRREAVLSLQETRDLVCALAAIHAHFGPLLDPNGNNRTFAMQVEWKLLPGSRAVAIKQARPQPFGSVDVPKDCREF
ncbi:MAG TPA: PEP/pyruvate-binding domain-containing protein, partial [Polyangiales bacterium]